MKKKPFNPPPGYGATLDRMVAAGRAWIEVHPGIKPTFEPLGVPREAVVIAELDDAMLCRVAKSQHARSFLRALLAVQDKGGTSILQAEGVIEFLFGTERALTVHSGKPVVQ